MTPTEPTEEQTGEESERIAEPDDHREGGDETETETGDGDS
jgi:hypothetical protein